MSLFVEGLQVVHAFFAPQEVRRLARQFEENAAGFTHDHQIQRAIRAQSADEAAYFAQHSGLNRRDMRKVVSTHVQWEDFVRFRHLVISSHDKSGIGNMETIKGIDDYIAFRRSHRAFFAPNFVGRALDKVNSLIPSLPLTPVTPRVSR